MQRQRALDASSSVGAGDGKPIVTFEQYVAAQGPALLRLAFVLTGDRHLAEDLSQTALATAYRHWRKVSTARDPEATASRALATLRHASAAAPVEEAR